MTRPFQATVIGVAKALKPEQLKVELGGTDVFTSGGGPVLDGSIPFDVMADVPQATLAAAVTAHVPNPDFGLPPNQATLNQRIRGALTTNSIFLAQPSPRSALQIENQLVNVTKECSALIRLFAGLLDSTGGT